MAHKKAGGSSNNGRDSAGRRLGVKKYGGGLNITQARMLVWAKITRSLRLSLAMSNLQQSATSAHMSR